MTSSLLDTGYGCDLDLIRALGQYSEDFCHKQSTDFSHDEQNFVNIPIVEWDGEHCVSWVLSTCHKRGLEAFCIDLGLLSNTSGMLLLQSTKQDFCQMMGDTLGRIFYKEMQELKGTQREKGYSNDRVPYIPNDSYNSYTQDIQYYNGDQDASNPSTMTYGTYDTHTSPGCLSVDSYNDEYSHSPGRSPRSLRYEGSPNYQNFGDSQIYGQYSLDESALGVMDDLDNIDTKDLIRLDSYEIAMAYQDDALNLSGAHNQMYNQTWGDNEESKPCQKSEDLVGSDSLELAKDSCEKVAASSTKKREREPKNWEFLIRLLADPRANPKLIRWEDETMGTFLLVQPEIITHLWNSRTNKSPVTYHNFARGLRYHYRTGALFNVADRQLVYGCGPKAIEFLNKIKAKIQRSAK
ncbi:unnamed protein product [Meganyctiphanes norvegica]|uniref:ETS domain-containing protein n=1 Tax=Meganyctiphanes norvegica TaxID=48144 RepID=A0AAV2SEI6_MEGNR